MVAGGCCLARLRALRSESHMPHRSERFWTRIGASKNASTLKVFQWNVLADGLAQHGDFVRVCDVVRASLIWLHAFPVSLGPHCTLSTGASASVGVVLPTAFVAGRNFETKGRHSVSARG